MLPLLQRLGDASAMRKVSSFPFHQKVLPVLLLASVRVKIKTCLCFYDDVINRFGFIKLYAWRLERPKFDAKKS